MERVFQFRDRLVINFPLVTLVVVNLPKDDADRVGRLRDHLAGLAEGANARMAAMRAETERATQAAGIAQAANDLAASVALVEQQQSGLRLRSLELMNGYVLDLERSFVGLELTEKQERHLSGEARKLRDKLGDALGESKDTADKLKAIAAHLQRLMG